MSDSLLSALSTKLNEHLITDFNAYLNYLFGYINKELGFKNPLLFILNEKKQELFLTHSKVDVKIPMISGQSLLIDSLNSQEVLSTSNQRDIFSKSLGIDVSSKSLWIILPIIVFSRPFGVFVLSAPQEKKLTKQEIRFLTNFADTVSMPTYTSWTLQQAITAQQEMIKKNIKYLELIKVKKTFLEDLQQLLVQCIQQDLFNQKTTQDILASLAYLHSVLLLSDSTVKKEKTNK